jgi:hypothetical protein
VSPVRYEPGFYIPEDAILHSHRRENLKSYIKRRLFLFPGLITLPGVFPFRTVTYKLGFLYGARYCMVVRYTVTILQVSLAFYCNVKGLHKCGAFDMTRIRMLYVSPWPQDEYLVIKARIPVNVIVDVRKSIRK